MHFPQRWFEGVPEHDQAAPDDAIGQGMLGIIMIRQRLNPYAQSRRKLTNSF
jgi:hypothetical protein